MAQTSSLNCLSCRNPCQNPSFIACLLLSLRISFSSLKSASSHPLPENWFPVNCLGFWDFPRHEHADFRRNWFLRLRSVTLIVPPMMLSAPKSRDFCDLKLQLSSRTRNRSISETRQCKTALRAQGTKKKNRWRLRFRGVGISEPKPRSFCGKTGDLALAMPDR